MFEAVPVRRGVPLDVSSVPKPTPLVALVVVAMDVPFRSGLEAHHGRRRRLAHAGVETEQLRRRRLEQHLAGLPVGDAADGAAGGLVEVVLDRHVPAGEEPLGRARDRLLDDVPGRTVRCRRRRCGWLTAGARPGTERDHAGRADARVDGKDGRGWEGSWHGRWCWLGPPRVGRRRAAAARCRGYWRRRSICCGIWFAWASMATLACWSTWEEENFAISVAMSTSMSVERAASRFSTEVDKLAETNWNRDIRAPMSARAALTVEIAVSRLLLAVVAPAVVSTLVPVRLRPEALVSTLAMLTAMVSLALAPTWKLIEAPPATVKPTLTVLSVTSMLLRLTLTPEFLKSTEPSKTFWPVAQF